MHKFYPKNRHLHVEPLYQEKEESVVLVPTEYQPKNEYIAAKVISASEDCSGAYPEGSRILIPGHVLLEVDIQDTNIYIVQENFVLGLLV